MNIIRSKKHLKLFISLILGFLVVALGWLADKNPELFKDISSTVPAGYYHVVKVEDGDTITVDMNGTSERIRFIGIDTPELHDPRKPVQCFARAAKDYNKSLIGQNPVRLEADPLSTNRDRYDRLLRYVYLPDGRLAQAEIIKNGYGFAYTSFPFTKSEQFLNYQTQAREQNRGLWKDCRPTPNEYGGFTSNNAQ